MEENLNVDKTISEEAMEKSVLALLHFEVKKYCSRLKKRIVLETEIYIL